MHAWSQVSLEAGVRMPGPRSLPAVVGMPGLSSLLEVGMPGSKSLPGGGYTRGNSEYTGGALEGGYASVSLFSLQVTGSQSK